MSALRRRSGRHARPGRSLKWLNTVGLTLSGAATLLVAGSYFSGVHLVGQATTYDVSDQLGDRPEQVVITPSPTATGSSDPQDVATGKPVNILLMGSDVRTGDNAALGGAGKVTGMRNDTTIIMHISGDRTRVELVSIPRDSRVKIEDCLLSDGRTIRGWTGKFNIAFANGGKGGAGDAAACTIRTVEALTSIFIDHYVVVDFTGVINIVNSLGGVPMCIPNNVRSDKAGLNLKAGPQVLNGYNALAYARLRTADNKDSGVNGSDLQRIERQQDLIAAIMEKVLSQDTLTDVGKITNVLDATFESMTMDPELANFNYIVGLAYSLKDIDPDNITFATVPWEYTDDFLDVLWVEPAATQMFDDIRYDRGITGTTVASSSHAGDVDNEIPGVPVEVDVDVNEQLLGACD